MGVKGTAVGGLRVRRGIVMGGIGRESGGLVCGGCRSGVRDTSIRGCGSGVRGTRGLTGFPLPPTGPGAGPGLGGYPGGVIQPGKQGIRFSPTAPQPGLLPPSTLWGQEEGEVRQCREVSLREADHRDAPGKRDRSVPSAYRAAQCYPPTNTLAPGPLPPAKTPTPLPPTCCPLSCIFPTGYPAAGGGFPVNGERQPAYANGKGPLFPPPRDAPYLPPPL